MLVAVLMLLALVVVMVVNVTIVMSSRGSTTVSETMWTKMLLYIRLLRVGISVFMRTLIPVRSRTSGCLTRIGRYWAWEVTRIFHRIYQLRDLALTARTHQALLITEPFITARMTEYDLATCRSIKMLAVVGAQGRHGRLVTLIERGSGAQSKADCKTC
jgi:hypothetical protein